MMNIAVTGFYGTGSSAVIDILKEFNNCSLAIRDNYEHNVLFVPNGIFDLEDKLFQNKDPFRADEAIWSFLDAMDNLYMNDYGWFGSYKNLLGIEFKKIVNDFVDKISCRSEGEWYGRYVKTRFSFSVWFAQTILTLFCKKTWVRKGKVDIIDRKTPLYSCFVDKNVFYDAAKVFINSYMELCNINKTDYVVFDHLLWLQNGYRIENYFPENFRLLVVKRDPRDVYFSEKYIWQNYYKTKILPSDVDMFIKYYKWLFEYCEFNKEVVKIINFEDLVYDYDNSVQNILDFVGMEKENHVNKKQYFDPDISIENTQVFKADFINKDECKRIENELEGLLYDFPYEKVWDSKKSFV